LIEWLVAVAILVAALLPFSNWWKERQARDRAEQLLDRLRALATNDIPTSVEFGGRFGSTLADYTGYAPDSDVILQLAGLAAGVFEAERFSADAIPPPPARYDSYHGEKYAIAIRNQIEKLSDRTLLEEFAQKVFESVFGLCEALPKSSSGDLSFSVKIGTSISDLPAVVQDMILTYLARPARDRGLFSALATQLEQNIYAASGLAYRGKFDHADRIVLPEKYKGADVVDVYLRNTPLRDIFEGTVHFSIPAESRFEHTHVVAGTGHGKTQTLQHLILHDLQTDAGLVIVDSQGEMLRKVASLRTDKELIDVDPTDMVHLVLDCHEVGLARFGLHAIAYYFI